MSTNEFKTLYPADLLQLPFKKWGAELPLKGDKQPYLKHIIQFGTLFYLKNYVATGRTHELALKDMPLGKLLNSNDMSTKTLDHWWMNEPAVNLEKLNYRVTVNIFSSKDIFTPTVAGVYAGYGRPLDAPWTDEIKDIRSRILESMRPTFQQSWTELLSLLLGTMLSYRHGQMLYATTHGCNESVYKFQVFVSHDEDKLTRSGVHDLMAAVQVFFVEFAEKKRLKIRIQNTSLKQVFDIYPQGKATTARAAAGKKQTYYYVHIQLDTLNEKDEKALFTYLNTKKTVFGGDILAYDEIDFIRLNSRGYEKQQNEFLQQKKKENEEKEEESQKPVALCILIGREIEFHDEEHGFYRAGVCLNGKDYLQDKKSQPKGTANNTHFQTFTKALKAMEISY